MSIEDKRLERIEVKIDDVSEHLGSIDATLAAQHVSLVEHIKRTEILEREVRPIRRHVYMVQGAAALIGLLATIAGIIALFK